MDGTATEALPGLADVRAAEARLDGHVLHTPLQASRWLEQHTGTPVLLKLECRQHTGSFKVRGALNAVALLSPGARARGLVTASAGNHGQAVALAARQHGARAVVYVPADAPDTKKDRIRGLGAELREEASDYDEAEVLARECAARDGLALVHAFSDPAVIAGQGTVALELLDDIRALGITDVIVPVGGGGLATGVGAVLKALVPGITITGVQSTETRAMYEAFRAGRAVDVPVPPTLADGLAGCTDEATYRRARQVVDDIVLVSESAIADAISELHGQDGITAEGAGAVAVAALAGGHVQPRGGCIAIVSGGNIDGRRLAGILGRVE
ncbi:MAG TPA: pyridoxal-phosphate dependent enzyme [Longimicrobiales bacterium]|nr:pyridoxal-phosphate dependent enzyme [Longimicrobiales bacterium]